MIKNKINFFLKGIVGIVVLLYLNSVEVCGASAACMGKGPGGIPILHLSKDGVSLGGVALNYSTSVLINFNALGAGSTLKPLTSISEKHTPFLFMMRRVFAYITGNAEEGDGMTIKEFFESTDSVGDEDFAAECQQANDNVAVDFATVLKNLRADLKAIQKLMCPSPVVTDATVDDGGGG